MRAVRWLILGIFLLSLGRSTPALAAAPEDLPVSNPGAEYTFGDSLSLHADVSVAAAGSAQPPQIFVFFQSTAGRDVVQGKAELRKSRTAGIWTAAYRHDLSRQPLPVFSDVNYWFGLLAPDGKIQASKMFSFKYEDNRHAWQSQDARPFHFYWYAGDPQMAREALSAAWDGLSRAQEILPLAPPEEVRIYAYTSPQDLQSAVKLGALDGTSGHTDPAGGLIVLAVPPEAGKRQEMTRQIPHELMHILLYNRYGEAYRNLPVWLVEGLAERVEPYPDPQEADLLLAAHARKTLIPLDALCRAFPRDASASLLASAQASSFVDFLFRRYNAEGVERLLDSYRDGTACERGVELALGSSLLQLEEHWKEETLQGTSPAKKQGTLDPWWLLFALVIIVPFIVGLRRIFSKPAE